MIAESFLHLRGVGPHTQRRFLEAGFRCWDDVLARPEALPFAPSRRQGLIDEIQASVRARHGEDIRYFVERFPTGEHWRILAEYGSRASYFDIETSGLSRYEAEITVIVCFHRGEYHTFVRGENLDSFLDLLEDVELLVSFNGNCFDVPFVEDAFRIPSIPCPHVDLRWVCYHGGLRGTLGDVEDQCGIERPPDIQGVDGIQAVILWNAWKRRGDAEALNRLLRYCRADVEALVRVAGQVVGERRSRSRGLAGVRREG